jgi:hypothetical protein
VWAIILQDFTVGFDGDTSIKDSRLDRRKVLGKAFVFMSNLERQFTSVAQNEARDFIFFHIELMQGSQDKDSSLSHTRLGLTDDITSQNSLRNRFVLDLTGMLKTSVNNSTEQFWFQQEVFETRGMDTDIMTSVKGLKDDEQVIKLMRYSWLLLFWVRV